MTPPPQSTGSSGTRSSAGRPYGGELRRLIAAVSPAAWVALLGGALVLTSAGIVLSGDWGSAGPILRFVALLLTAAGLSVGAQRIRVIAPNTAGITAHVGTFLSAAVGVSGTSMFGYAWPTCLLVGGVLAAAATEVQASRWGASTMHAGQTVAIAIAATGLAALTGTTAGLVAGLAALGFLAIGADRRAGGLAVLAVTSPVLWMLANAGIGIGALDRAGITGDRLGWSGPIVGVLAALVAVIAGRRLQNSTLTVVAAGAPVFGLVTGLAATSGQTYAWWCAPALAVLGIELAVSMMPNDRKRAIWAPLLDAVNAVLAGAAVLAPVAVAIMGPGSGFGSDLAARAHSGALAAAVTALALCIATVRWRRADARTADLGLAAVASCVVATVIGLAAALGVIAAVAVFCVAASTVLSRRLGRLAVYVPSVWAAYTIVVLGVDDSIGAQIANDIGALVGLAALVGLIVTARTRLAGRRRRDGLVEMSLMTCIAVLMAVGIVGVHAVVVAAIAVSLVSLAIVAIDRTFILWLACINLAVVGYVTVNELDADISMAWIGWVVVVAALAAVGSLLRSRVASFAAGSAATIAVMIGAASWPLEDSALVGLAMVLTIALTGLALTIGRRSPIDTAALTAGVLMIGMLELDIDPLWVSGAWFVLGAQVAAYGFGLNYRQVSLVGSLVALGAAFSAWFTSGAHGWMMELVEPADVRAGDLWLFAATVAALVAGFAARRTLTLNSWLAYGAGFLIGGIWLIEVQVERDTMWAIPAAVTLGALGVGIGGWRRLAAPLVCGVTLIVWSVLLASADDLREVPTWGWLATGGLALLGVAVLIERASKVGTEGLRELVAKWN
jgi:hypothetical protein